MAIIPLPEIPHHSPPRMSEAVRIELELDQFFSDRARYLARARELNTTYLRARANPTAFGLAHDHTATLDHAVKAMRNYVATHDDEFDVERYNLGTYHQREQAQRLISGLVHVVNQVEAAFNTARDHTADNHRT